MTESEKQPPPLKKRVLSLRQKRLHNTQVGSRGEARARQFLIAAGWQIWEHNVRFKNHELDIVAFDPINQEVVFVEVKTRASDHLGHPSKAWSYAKRKSSEQAAKKFMANRQLDYDYRFDLVAVLPDSIEHFENITWNT